MRGRQKPEDRQFEPHGWQRHYTGRYMMSGISRYIYEYLTYLIILPDHLPLTDGS